jgi:hypothetical protein
MNCYFGKIPVFKLKFNFNETELTANLFNLSKYGTKYALGLLRKEQESKE